MRCLTLGIAVAIWSIAFPLASWVSAADATGADLVEDRLASLDAWLAPTPTQAGWDRYLMLVALRDQLKSSTPDAAVVSLVLSRFRSGVNGLDDPHFVAVRVALGRWIAGDKFYAEQLPKLVRAAKFRPVTPEDLEQKRKALAARLGELNVFLGPRANGDRWREFLLFERLATALQQGKDAAPDDLYAVAGKFAGSQAGLEMPPFRHVADALQGYRYTLSAVKNANLEPEFHANIDQLADLLEKPATDPDFDFDGLSRVVRWLESHDQAADAVGAIQNRFALRNLYARVSERVMTATSYERYNEVLAVAETVEGTRVTGNAFTAGDLVVELIPDQTRAQWDALFLGQTITETVGRNRSAVINLRGRTQLTGRKRIVMDLDGVHTAPATADASTHMSTTGIGSTAGGIRGCIVERVASRKVAEQMPGAEQTTSSRAAAAMRKRLDDRAAGQVAEANRSFWEKFRRPLFAKGELPRDLTFQTSPDHLILTGAFGGPADLAAPTLPPATTGNPDLSLRVHETAINNLTQGMLAGQTLNSENVKNEMLNSLGTAPEPAEDEADREPWSITFAVDKPVEVHFPDGGVRVTIRGQHYTSGDRDYRAMNVTANYRFEETPNGLRAIRQGDLEIFPPGFVPGQRKLSIAEQTLRNMLERRMGKIFATEIGGKDITLPGRLAKAGPMTTTQLQSQSGWLSVGLTEKANSTAVQTAMNR